MDIETLKEIITLADKKSYSAAADELFITQSSLSRHIQDAERKLGVQLFYRSSRQVQLTKCGEIILPYAKQIAELETGYINKIEEEKCRERVELRIGSISGLSAFGIMSAVAGFLAKNSDVGIQMLRYSTEQLKNCIKDGECDFAFAQELTASAEDGLNRFTVATDNLVVVLPKSHPLAKEKKIRLEQVKNETWFLQHDRKLLTKMMMDAFRKNNIDPEISSLNAEGMGVLELVEKKLGICMEFRMIAEEKHNQGTALLEIENAETVYINMIWRNVPLSPVGKSFVNYMKKTMG